MVKPVGGSASNTQTVQSPPDTSGTDSAAAAGQAEGAAQSQGSQNVPQGSAGSQDSTAAPQSLSDSKSQIAEHALGGQLQAAVLQSQIPGAQVKGRQLEGKVQDPPKEGGGAKPTGKPPDTTMQTLLTNSGMQGVHTPPTDAELKTYYSTKGPAHDMVAQGKYSDAAAEYRKLAGASTDTAEKSRLNTAANQLDVAQTMKDAKVGNLSFPPSEANVTAYFGTLRGKPLGDIQGAFQSYANAYYVHSETKGVDRGDVVYSPHDHQVGNTIYKSNAPETWGEVTDKRELHSDGRRVIDCEGYALMGKKFFQAAGFQNVKYAVASRADDPNTPEDESLTRQHIMITGSRTVKGPDGNQTEVAVISNNRFTSRTSDPNPKPQDFDQLQTDALIRGYRDTFKETHGNTVKIPGGLMVTGDESWRAEYDLEDAIKAQRAKNAPH